MRGKILQYNGTGGSGVIVADGQPYRFDIAIWKGNAAPAVAKAVELSLSDGVLGSVIPVADDVILKEKVAELKDKFGGLMGGLSASIAVPYCWRVRRGWLALGLPLLAVLWALWSGVHAVSGMSGGLGGGNDGPGFFDLFSSGFGFYLSLAAALYLAVTGFKRFLLA